MKITFVCTGNTCRSPMLMAMFSDYARKVGFDCVTDSAGIMGGGSPVNPKTVCVLRARGIDVGDYTSKVFDGKLAEESDFVFTMTENNIANRLEKYFSFLKLFFTYLHNFHVNDKLILPVLK